MLPEGPRKASKEGLEASGTPLGTKWAQSGRQERGKSHFKAEVEAMLGSQKLPKIDQDAKKNFPDSFSIAKRRKMMTRDPLEKKGPKQPRRKP